MFNAIHNLVKRIGHIFIVVKKQEPFSARKFMSKANEEKSH